LILCLSAQVFRCLGKKAVGKRQLAVPKNLQSVIAEFFEPARTYQHPVRAWHPRKKVYTFFSGLAIFLPSFNRHQRNPLYLFMFVNKTIATINDKFSHPFRS
jgi:hypothetical protein